MPPLNAATRAHLWRLIRFCAFISTAGPAVFALIQPWVIRWPMLGVVFTALEVIVRTISPTVPAPSPAARHASTIGGPLAQPVPGPPTSEQVYTPVTQPAEPVQPPGERPDPAQTP